MQDLKLVLNLESISLPTADVPPSLPEAGYRFLTLAQVGDSEPARRNLYTLVREGVEDTPGFTGEFETYLAFIKRLYRPSYQEHAESQFLALYGEAWVGLSSLVVQPGSRAIFGLTVVTKAHRGRGIARALKLSALEYAREVGVKTITTENHPENLAILRLNRGLGFEG